MRYRKLAHCCASLAQSVSAAAASPVVDRLSRSAAIGFLRSLAAAFAAGEGLILTFRVELHVPGQQSVQVASDADSSPECNFDLSFPFGANIAD